MTGDHSREAFTYSRLTVNKLLEVAPGIQICEESGFEFHWQVQGNILLGACIPPEALEATK